MGNFYSQCAVDMGIQFVLEQHLITARAEEDVHFQNVIHPCCLETLTESYCWQLVMISPALESQALSYLRPETNKEGHRVARHVAAHERRGDHKYMTSYLQIDKGGKDELSD